MDTVTIGTLRTQTAAREAPAVLSHLGRLLASADLAAPGLPPQAVLIVRRLTDPQPGRLAARLQDVRVRAEWERGVRERLAEVQRRAARPALGHAPAEAEAALFADESELLACLARDIARDQVRRWWWETLLASGPTLHLTGGDYAAILVKRLVEQARSAPAVMVRLAKWGEAAAVLRVLTLQQAGAVLGAMLKAYGLPELSGSAPETARPPAAPWSIPEGMGRTAVAGLGREREALLGLALDLITRPQTVASRGYQRSLRAWWQSAGRERPATAAASQPDAEPTGSARTHQDERRELAATRPTRSNEHGTDGPEIGAAEVGEKQRPVQAQGEAGRDWNANAAHLDQDMIGGPPASDDGKEVPDGVAAGAGAHQVSETTTHLNSREARSEPSGTITPTSNDERGDAQASAGAASPPELAGSQRAENGPIAQAEIDAASAASLLELLGEGVATELGGVLYLINLMVALDLPDAFEAGWRLASGVGPWGLLEVLGRELLGADAAADDGDDPLWLALAHLDGRAAGEPPGVRLPKSRPRRWPAFELPARWRAGMAEAGELRRPTPKKPRPYSGGYRPLLARWLGLALPVIEERLRLALGAEGGEPTIGELLRLPGRLYVGRTHVDLVASVEHISLAARLAGLDRNPGWRPDFGRVVYFHFE